MEILIFLFAFKGSPLISGEVYYSKELPDRLLRRLAPYNDRVVDKLLTKTTSMTKKGSIELQSE